MTPDQAIDAFKRLRKEQANDEYIVQWIGREHGYEDRFTQAAWDEGALTIEDIAADGISRLVEEYVDANEEAFVDPDAEDDEVSDKDEVKA